MRRRDFFDFKYIGIALIFLIDFNINSIDILPDFIAVLFILKAIGKAYYINESFAEARTYLKVFCVVSIIKFTTGILYFLLLRDSHEDYGSMMLLIVSVTALFEIILCVNIFRRIFKGIEQFSFLSGSFEKTNNGETAANILNIFFIVKFALAFAGHAPLLLTDTDLESWSMAFNTFLTSDILINMFIPPFFIIQLLLGVFMLSAAAPFFGGVSKDKNIKNFIDSNITRKLTEDYFFRLKLNLRSSFALFIAGCVFFVDLKIENIMLLPDFMICVLFFFGAAQIAGGDSGMTNKKLNIYLTANFFISGCAYILTSVYNIRVFTAFENELPELYNIKTAADIFYHASVILFTLIFIELYYFIKKLQYKHMQFSSDYLKKYFTAGEKILYGGRDKIFICGAAVFSVKTLGSILPADGFIMFLHSLVLIIFAGWGVKSLVKIKEDIYNYYI